MQSELLLVEVPLPQVSELTLFSLVTWPNTDTQFKLSIRPLNRLAQRLLFCTARAIFTARERAFLAALVMPLSRQPSVPTQGLSLKLAWVPVFLLRVEVSGQVCEGLKLHGKVRVGWGSCKHYFV